MPTSIDMETLLTTVFVEVDDWYQGAGADWRSHKRGVRPVCKDSEILTLLLVQDYLPYPGETQFLGYIRANYGTLFPYLPDQSQFNRRARGLRDLLELLRQTWVQSLLSGDETVLIIDTKPLPVMGYKRSKAHSDFAHSATYGYCSSRKMHYFGYKLVTLTTLAGLPLVYELVPAHTDERQAADTVLAQVRGCDILGDKGFIGQDWHWVIEQETGNRLWTFQRYNQKKRHPSVVKYFLQRFRRQIETTFHVLQNTGRHLERLLAHSVVGLCTRVATKMTSYVLTILLKQKYGIDVRTFEAI